jgi:hypothetical protein
MAKSSCPLSQSQFLAKAEPLKIAINGQEMLAEVKAFSTAVRLVPERQDDDGKAGRSRSA